MEIRPPSMGLVRVGFTRRIAAIYARLAPDKLSRLPDVPPGQPPEKASPALASRGLACVTRWNLAVVSAEERRQSDGSGTGGEHRGFC
jgi:hypothetical protein